MSRIGKQPVNIPDKVEVTLEPQANGAVKATVKGPLGTLTRIFRPEIQIRQEGNVIYVEKKQDDRISRALFGLSRTLLDNMVQGVSKGFVKDLEIIGVGYKAQMQGTKLVLALGYSHPVEIQPPEGITITVEQNTKLKIVGADKQAVGDVSALIRSKRPPEPYKGKGVRYAGERINRKAGKSGKAKK